MGSLGLLRFEKGTYIYVGSAKNGLWPRLRRHFSKEKKIHWHIDFLLEKARPLYALAFEGEKPTECDLNQSVAELPNSLPIKGFGCSDCRCFSHLHKVNAKSLRRLEEIFPEARRLLPKDFQ